MVAGAKMKNKPREVTFRLKDILEERKIRQYELADRMGIHKQTVSRLTVGVRMIDLGTLARLCDALDVEPGDLLVRAPVNGDRD
jgi:putative transcriptional regulator